MKELLNKDLKTTIRYTSTFHILKKIVETMDMLRRYIKDIFLKIQIEFLQMKNTPNMKKYNKKC